MKGTEEKHHPKCVALKGVVGKFVECSIYENRSSTCRKFEASYETGTARTRCDEARAKHGLRPLNKQDWR
jgi:Fe-S-cluster containining protein